MEVAHVHLVLFHSKVEMENHSACCICAREVEGDTCVSGGMETLKLINCSQDLKL